MGECLKGLSCIRLVLSIPLQQHWNGICWPNKVEILILLCLSVFTGIQNEYI